MKPARLVGSPIRIPLVGIFLLGVIGYGGAHAHARDDVGVLHGAIRITTADPVSADHLAQNPVDRIGLAAVGLLSSERLASGSAAPAAPDALPIVGDYSFLVPLGTDERFLVTVESARFDDGAFLSFGESELDAPVTFVSDRVLPRDEAPQGTRLDLQVCGVALDANPTVSGAAADLAELGDEYALTVSAFGQIGRTERLLAQSPTVLRRRGDPNPDPLLLLLPAGYRVQVRTSAVFEVTGDPTGFPSVPTREDEPVTLFGTTGEWFEVECGNVRETTPTIQVERSAGNARGLIDLVHPDPSLYREVRYNVVARGEGTGDGLRDLRHLDPNVDFPPHVWEIEGIPGAWYEFAARVAIEGNRILARFPTLTLDRREGNEAVPETDLGSRFVSVVNHVDVGWLFRYPHPDSVLTALQLDPSPAPGTRPRSYVQLVGLDTIPTENGQDIGGASGAGGEVIVGLQPVAGNPNQLVLGARAPIFGVGRESGRPSGVDARPVRWNMGDYRINLDDGFQDQTITFRSRLDDGGFISNRDRDYRAPGGEMCLTDVEIAFRTTAGIEIGNADLTAISQHVDEVDPLGNAVNYAGPRASMTTEEVPTEERSNEFAIVATLPANARYTYWFEADVTPEGQNRFNTVTLAPASVPAIDTLRCGERRGVCHSVAPDGQESRLAIEVTRRPTDDDFTIGFTVESSGGDIRSVVLLVDEQTIATVCTEGQCPNPVVETAFELTDVPPDTRRVTILATDSSGCSAYLEVLLPPAPAAPVRCVDFTQLPAGDPVAEIELEGVAFFTPGGEALIRRVDAGLGAGIMFGPELQLRMPEPSRRVDLTTTRLVNRPTAFTAWTDDDTAIAPSVTVENLNPFLPPPGSPHLIDRTSLTSGPPLAAIRMGRLGSEIILHRMCY